VTESKQRQVRYSPVLKRVAAIVCAIGLTIVLYTLCGFFLAPLWLEDRLEQAATRGTDNKLVVQSVSFNPYTFRLRLQQSTLTDADGLMRVSVPEIHARLDPGALLTLDPQVPELIIERPDFFLAPRHLAPPGRSTVHAVLARWTTDFRGLLELAEVGQIVVRRGTIRMNTPGAPPAGPPNVAELDLSVGTSGGAGSPGRRFNVTAAVQRSTLLDGSGRIEYVDGYLRVDGDLELRDIAIAAPATGSPFFSSAVVDVAGMRIDTSRPRPLVDSLHLQQPHLSLARNSTGEVAMPDWIVQLAQGSAAAAALIGRVEISAGSATFVDVLPDASPRLEFDSMNGVLTPRGSSQSHSLEIQLQGRLPGSGINRIAGSWPSSDPARPEALELTLVEVGLPLLSPYFRRLTGRGLDAGRLELTLSHAQGRDGADTNVDFSVHDLALGDCDRATTDEPWPLDMAVALLEDSDGGIAGQLHAEPRQAGADRAPESPFIAALANSLRDFVEARANRPFRTLAEVAGEPEMPLDQIMFDPGTAEITATADTRLGALGAALVERPGLDLSVAPAFDPTADRDALAEQQTRLHVVLATSANPPGRARRETLDFDDAKTHTVLDEFSTERLTESTRNAVSARFPEQDAAFYQAIFRALVADAVVSRGALARLANYRARSVVDRLVASGVESARVSRAADLQQVESLQDAVPLPLEVNSRTAEDADCRDAGR